jgi:hypothetical protein
MQTGNTTATPEYTLSMIEKAMTNATEFASVFNLFLGKKRGGSHVDVIKAANEFAQALSETLLSSKGITRFIDTDDASDKLVKVAKGAGDAGQRFFLNLQSFRLLAGGKTEEIALRNNAEARNALSKLAETVEKLVPKAKTTLAQANGDIGDIVSQEMQNAARAIEEATQRIQSLMARPKGPKYNALDVQVHDAILEATLAITNAIGRLIQAATESQEEIVREGKGSSTTQQFYKRNNRWTEGLISAAKAVAYFQRGLCCNRPTRRRLASQGVSDVEDSATSRGCLKGCYRRLQSSRQASQDHLEPAGGRGGRGLQIHAITRIQGPRDGTAGGDPQVGEGAGSGKKEAGRDASGRISPGDGIKARVVVYACHLDTQKTLDLFSNASLKFGTVVAVQFTALRRVCQQN